MERLGRSVSVVVKRFPCIVSVILFGSRARGDAGLYSDTDLLIVVEDRDCISIGGITGILLEYGIPNPSIIVREVRGLRIDSLFRAVLSEGLVLYTRPPLSPLLGSALGLKPMVLVFLEMPKDKRLRWRAEKKIYGDKYRKGLVERLSGCKLAPKLVMLPASKSREFEEEAMKLGVRVKRKLRIFV